jgi:FkbM family methyltransferase
VPKGPLALIANIARLLDVQTDLIYDVGMNDGTDSAYYLHRGFRVVAVEANPILAAEAERRFADEMAAGRFAVAQVGVAEQEGEAEFWVCDDWSPWSSFDLEIASRNGSKHHSERVPLRRMGQLLEQYGMPFYCKVDIEGHDQFCFDSMTPENRPTYMSVELSEYPFVEKMHELGFDRFKMIHQLSFSPVSGRWFSRRAHIPNEKARAGLERLRGVARRSLIDRTWYFKIGSSGPLPTLTPGEWVDYEQMLKIRAWVDDRYKDDSFGLLDCFDLHATSSSELGRVS